MFSLDRKRIEHVDNFSIPNQRVDKDIPPKGKLLVEVTFPTSGVVRFFCKFHSALGMNGMLLTGDAKPLAVSVRNPNSME